MLAASVAPRPSGEITASHPATCGFLSLPECFSSGVMSLKRMGVERATRWVIFPSPNRRSSTSDHTGWSYPGGGELPWAPSPPTERGFPAVIMAASVRGSVTVSGSRVCLSPPSLLCCSGFSVPPAGAACHPSLPAAPGSSAAGIPEATRGERRLASVAAAGETEPQRPLVEEAARYKDNRSKCLSLGFSLVFYHYITVCNILN